MSRSITGGTPVAVSMRRGTLYVHFDLRHAGVKSCGVATFVNDFEVSENRFDDAIAYFVTRRPRSSRNELRSLEISGVVSPRFCPNVRTNNLLTDSRVGGSLARMGSGYAFRLVRDSRSRTIGVALTNRGDVLEWTDRGYRRYHNVGRSGYERIWREVR